MASLKGLILPEGDKTKAMKGVEYRGVTSVDGPIIVLKSTENVFYNETVCVRDRNGNKRTGKVVDISESAVVVQIFGSTTGLDLDETSFEFLDQPATTMGIAIFHTIFNLLTTAVLLPNRKLLLKKR